MEKEMTAGSPAKIIFGFTIPIFIGNVFQQFYSMVDTIIVGKFVGTQALAAVGSTSTITFLILGFLMGLTVGFTVLTAQRFGAGDPEGMRRTVGSAAILSAIISLLITLVSIAGMRPLLLFMHTPKDIFADAYTYVIIICAGIFAQVLYNLLSCVLRALGNSKTPLYFLILAAFLNIVLDLLFIVSFKMGVAGAAWATVISQGISGVLCLLYIIKKVPLLHLNRHDWMLDGHVARLQLRVGLPMALQYSITAVGAMMMQSSLNLLGSLAVAGFTAANKIEQIVTQGYVAMGTTMATYCAQNTGAGDVKRVRQGFRAATRIGILFSIVAALLLLLGGKYMTYLFVSENVEEIMSSVDLYLRCTMIFFVPLAIVNIYRNGIQGMGFGLLPMTAGIAELIGRGAAAMVAAHYRSYLGVCLASPSAWLLAGLLLLAMYYFILHHYFKEPFFLKNRAAK
ncbi:MAG: MATE family efflux transporter [Lachnospiraceae bacterium]|nr:MATE family efflux transporter [Lachnospiraceae bacterium]